MSLTVGEDSYISLSEANSHFSSRLHTASWDDATSSTKEKALKMACSLLENRVVWRGSKTDSSQTLQWPRKNLLDHYSKPLEETKIPASVKSVQAELAHYLLQQDPMTVPGGITSMNLDGIQMDLGNAQETIPPKIFKPIEVWGQLLDSKATVKVTR